MEKENKPLGIERCKNIDTLCIKILQYQIWRDISEPEPVFEPPDL